MIKLLIISTALCVIGLCVGHNYARQMGLEELNATILLGFAGCVTGIAWSMKMAG